MDDRCKSLRYIHFFFVVIFSIFAIFLFTNITHIFTLKITQQLNLLNFILKYDFFLGSLLYFQFLRYEYLKEIFKIYQNLNFMRTKIVKFSHFSQIVHITIYLIPKKTNE